MPLPLAVIGISAAMRGISSIAQSITAARAQKRQLDYQRQALASYTKMFNESQKMGQPYREMGERLLARMEKEVTSGKLSDLYKLQSEESETAINRAMAGRGLSNSGAAIQALSDNARKLAAEEAQRQWGRQTEMLGLGGQFAAQGSQQGMQGAGAMANIYSQTGQIAGQDPWGPAIAGVGKAIQGGLQGYFTNQAVSGAKGYEGYSTMGRGPTVAPSWGTAPQGGGLLPTGWQKTLAGGEAAPAAEDEVSMAKIYQLLGLRGGI